jgi:hypothetical protein
MLGTLWAPTLQLSISLFGMCVEKRAPLPIYFMLRHSGFYSPLEFLTATIVVRPAKIVDMPPT